jgi:hypothetical protein
VLPLFFAIPLFVFPSMFTMKRQTAYACILLIWHACILLLLCSLWNVKPRMHVSSSYDMHVSSFFVYYETSNRVCMYLRTVLHVCTYVYIYVVYYYETSNRVCIYIRSVLHVCTYRYIVCMYVCKYVGGSECMYIRSVLQVCTYIYMLYARHVHVCTYIRRWTRVLLMCC